VSAADTGAGLTRPVVLRAGDALFQHHQDRCAALLPAPTLRCAGTPPGLERETLADCFRRPWAVHERITLTDFAFKPSSNVDLTPSARCAQA